MATFTSSRYPQLRVGSIAAFTDGQCTTTDKAAVAQLRKFATDDAYADYGISETTPAEGASGPKAPNRAASKADWVAYAVSQGADQAAAEALTRDALADQYGPPK
ncbi:hypothetical protein ACWGDX_03050 [Streptomyces sp. NPDC055025]